MYQFASCMKINEISKSRLTSKEFQKNYNPASLGQSVLSLSLQGFYMDVAGSVHVGSVSQGRKRRRRRRKKTINILNQCLSESLPPREPMGGLFKCKILHKDQRRVRDRDTRRGGGTKNRQMEKDKETEVEYAH